jgi:uncharacterized protein YdhG (YjbR/CyaY superfamily)
VAASLLVFGLLQHRDDGRFRQDQDAFEQLREQLAAVEAELSDLQAEVANKTKAIGFSVYKASAQVIPSAVISTITDWSTSGGPSAYDESGGAFNTTTGRFTAIQRAKYQCEAAICWNAGLAGNRVMVLVNTANAAMNSFDVDAYRGVGTVCTVSSVIFNLDVGEAVWIVVAQGTGFSQTIRTLGTTFSIERIAE